MKSCYAQEMKRCQVTSDELSELRDSRSSEKTTSRLDQSAHRITQEFDPKERDIVRPLERSARIFLGKIHMTWTQM